MAATTTAAVSDTAGLQDLVAALQNLVQVVGGLNAILVAAFGTVNDPNGTN